MQKPSTETTKASDREKRLKHLGVMLNDCNTAMDQFSRMGTLVGMALQKLQAGQQQSPQPSFATEMTAIVSNWGGYLCEAACLLADIHMRYFDLVDVNKLEQYDTIMVGAILAFLEANENSPLFQAQYQILMLRRYLQIISPYSDSENNKKITEMMPVVDRNGHDYIKQAQATDGKREKCYAWMQATYCFMAVSDYDHSSQAIDAISNLYKDADFIQEGERCVTRQINATCLDAILKRQVTNIDVYATDIARQIVREAIAAARRNAMSNNDKTFRDCTFKKPAAQTELQDLIKAFLLTHYSELLAQTYTQDIVKPKTAHGIAIQALYKKKMSSKVGPCIDYVIKKFGKDTLTIRPKNFAGLEKDLHALCQQDIQARTQHVAQRHAQYVQQTQETLAKHQASQAPAPAQPGPVAAPMSSPSKKSQPAQKKFFAPPKGPAPSPQGYNARRAPVKTAPQPQVVAGAGLTQNRQHY